MKNFILGLLTATLLCIGVFYITNNESDSKPDSVTYPKTNYTMENPAPLRTMQIYTKTDKNDLAKNYTVGIRVLDVYRGAEAYFKLKERASYRLDEPEDGYEYITAKVEFSVLETKTNLPVYVTDSYFFIHSVNGKKTTEGKRDFLLSEEFTDMHSGQRVEKWITYQVKTSDKVLRLSFDAYDNESEEAIKNYKPNPIWFALE